MGNHDDDPFSEFRSTASISLSLLAMIVAAIPMSETGWRRTIRHRVADDGSADQATPTTTTLADDSTTTTIADDSDDNDHRPR